MSNQFFSQYLFVDFLYLSLIVIINRMNAIYHAFLLPSRLYKKYSLWPKQSYFVSHLKDRPYGFQNIFPRKKLMQMESSIVGQFNNLLSQYNKDYLSTQKLQNIQKLITRIQSMGQNSEQIHLMLATCFFLQRKYQSAIREYNKAWKLCKQNTSDYCIKISICFIQSQNYFDAIKLLQNELSKHSDDSLIYHYLAIANSMMENYRESVINFYKSYLLGGQLEKEIIQKGQALLVEEKYRQALPIFIKWVIHKKDDEVALEGLKRCFTNSQKIEEGKQLYSHLDEIQAYHLCVSHSLGLFYFQIGQIKQAKSHLLEALEFKPNDFQLNLYLGTVYVQENQNDAAVACLQRCLNIRPDDPTVLSTLALVCMRLDQLQKAFTLSLKSTEVNGQDSMSWYGIGIIYLHKNEIQKGIKCLKKAIQLDEYNYPALEKLRSTLYLLGDEKEVTILQRKLEKAKEKMSSS